jgi:hypothetical protein
LVAHRDVTRSALVRDRRAGRMSTMTRAAESGNDSRFMRDRLQDTTADAPGGRQQVRIFRRGYRSLTGNIDFGD